MKPDELFLPAAEWTGHTRAGRIDACASMLFLHGYIPMNVREKIHKRLTKECETAIAMEAAKPSRRETGSTRKGDSAGPQDIAQESIPSSDMGKGE